MECHLANAEGAMKRHWPKQPSPLVKHADADAGGAGGPPLADADCAFAGQTSPGGGAQAIAGPPDADAGGTEGNSSGPLGCMSEELMSGENEDQNTAFDPWDALSDVDGQSGSEKAGDVAQLDEKDLKRKKQFNTAASKSSVSCRFVVLVLGVSLILELCV